DLEAVDRTLDSGQGAEKEIRYRSDIILKLQQCEEIDSLEMAQKAKIKWVVEGDENAKFFHGMLNKGLWWMVYGWMNRKLQSDQRNELEAEVTNDEIKKAVWECGTDKASGPDGFTFGFFRKFWYLVEKDVFDAV
nr:RNA-directed DNA polymerase, eukaryota [Tanacetum cinerariifolium]